MSTIEITDISEAREGDYFVGRRDKSFGRSAIEVAIRGPLIRYGARGRLYIEHFGTQPFVDSCDWYDVTITREIPDPPTILEQYLALRPGTRFRLGSPAALYRFMKLSDTLVVRYVDDMKRPEVRPLSDFSWDRTRGTDITVIEDEEASE